MTVSSAILQTVRRAGSGVLDLLYPPQCLVCGDPPSGDDARFCFECRRKIARERAQPACPRCAASVAPYEVHDERCSDCRGRRPHVARTVRVGPYGKLLGYMLRRYKYNDHGGFEAALGEWLTEAIRRSPWFAQVEAITCVPSHFTRRLFRSNDPAYELASMVAKRVDLPFIQLLHRVRPGQSQVGLTHSQRVVNVRGAFQTSARVRLQKASVLIIDDVRTTGATLNECAKMLRRAGAAAVFGAVVVRAHPDRADSRTLGPI